jgi:hypothetical protein
MKPIQFEMLYVETPEDVKRLKKRQKELLESDKD